MSATTSRGDGREARESGGQEEEVRDCVVVGGGIAGLAAAADLEKGGLDVLLLEAGDRFGGRIFTHQDDHVQDAKGQRPLELGAQWLHGTVGNPLYDFCVQEGIFESSEGKAELAMAKQLRTGNRVEARRPDGTLVHRREMRRFTGAWAKATREAELLYDRKVAEKSGEESASCGDREAMATNGCRRYDHLHSGSSHSGDENSRPVTDTSALTDVSARKKSVGLFLKQRVREIVRSRIPKGNFSPEEQREAGEPDLEEGIMGYLQRLQCSIEGCGDLDDVSISGYGVYQELDGGDVRVPGGFSRVVDVLAAKTSAARKRLNSPVTLVRWSETASLAESTSPDASRRKAGSGSDGPTSGGDAHSARIAEQDMGQASAEACTYPCVVEYTHLADTGRARQMSTRKIRCKYVIVTVSLGVLKDGKALAFHPPLPESKLSSIQRLGFGTADKVFVRCNRTKDASSSLDGLDHSRPDPDKLHVRVLRPLSESMGGTIESEEDEQGMPATERVKEQHRDWVKDVFSFVLERDHVCSWLTGSSARAMESAPANDVTDALLGLLRTVTQDPSWAKPNIETSDSAHQADEIATPSLVRSTWHSNPLFQGSYSYIATESSPMDLEELARPLSSANAKGGTEAPRVLFAGEATHPAFFSTAHGGFESGRRAAREVFADEGPLDGMLTSQPSIASTSDSTGWD